MTRMLELLSTMHQQENFLCGLAERRKNAKGKYRADHPRVLSRYTEPESAAKRQKHESNKDDSSTVRSDCTAPTDE
jgi:hypothetical protein